MNFILAALTVLLLVACAPSAPPLAPASAPPVAQLPTSAPTTSPTATPVPPTATAAPPTATIRPTATAAPTPTRFHPTYEYPTSTPAAPGFDRCAHVRDRVKRARLYGKSDQELFDENAVHTPLEQLVAILDDCGIQLDATPRPPPDGTEATYDPPTAAFCEHVEGVIGRWRAAGQEQAYYDNLHQVLTPAGVDVGMRKLGDCGIRLPGVTPLPRHADLPVFGGN